MSLSLRVDFSKLPPIARRIDLLGHIDKSALLDALGAEGASQTQRRIHFEKTSPDGVPWPAWTDQYAQTRHGGQSLLEADRNLLQSIQHQVVGDGVEWGSNLIYAAILNDGGRTKPHVIKPRNGKALKFGDHIVKQVKHPGSVFPAREYLGISAANAQDLLGVAHDYLNHELQAL